MPLSMYDVSVPVFTRALGQVSHLLDKAVAHAQATGTDPAALVAARLAPDMFPLSRQVQSASDAAKLGLARITGIAAPSFPDTESTFEELQARIAKTIDHLNSLERSQVDGNEERAISMKAGPNELSFTGHAYLLQFALPNFFFHVATAYGILRHHGVPVGKLDYLGRLGQG